jgi:hypothetical protein
MNITAASSLIAGSTLALAAAATAQQCLWDYHAGFSSTATHHEAIYHSASLRVMMVVFYSSAPTTQIFARQNGEWVLVNESGIPRRYDSAAAYDAARDRVIIFGGRTPSNQLINATYEWDGAAWHFAAASGPSARSGHAMVYDSVRQRTILFGGKDASGLLGDTWEWNGQSWVQVSTTGPEPRHLASSTFDPSRGRVILYGGAGAEPLADLWEWDGDAWTQRPGPTPGPHPNWIAYDAGRQRILLGRTLSPLSQQAHTWELEPFSNVWTLRDPARGREGRGTYDAAHSAVIFAGASLNTQATQIAPYITQWTFGGNFAVGSDFSLTAAFGGSAPITYQWYKDSAPLIDGGRISGATSAQYSDTGHYTITATNPCPHPVSAGAYVAILDPGGPCYPNCDQSTTPPILNIADFTCFLIKFAAQDPYANCDHSSAPPMFNVADFSCFLTKFAAGCV